MRTRRRPMTLHELIARIAGLKLECPVDFELDLDGLRDDLGRLQRHFEPGSHPAAYFNPNGGWKSFNLRSPGGDMNATVLSAGDEMRYTEAMEYAPNTRELIEALSDRAERVRFVSLEPGERVLWHYDRTTIDPRTNVKKHRPRIGRFHIPIHTNDDVTMNICGTICRWEEGQLYYADFGFPHMLENRSRQTRHHLVLDLLVRDNLLERFPVSFIESAGRRTRLRPWCQRACALFFRNTSASSYVQKEVLG